MYACTVCGVTAAVNHGATRVKSHGIAGNERGLAASIDVGYHPLHR
jgi:hypothetical protein